ncbi:hypothetical protein F4820DRAFT_323616 [Hypoxylon rubiginosum]|uniref:Uncharacterized protein n=1 Tax=Hypoxylon rubiginosum TaxID=110542 RepID=A0ACB9Z0L1_9PEZI|nr:hypothetical protein F4820DRAFT_323616 [Hypoxylon rubiginosum]
MVGDFRSYALYSRRGTSPLPSADPSTGISTSPRSSTTPNFTPEACKIVREAQGDSEGPFRDPQPIPRVSPQIYAYPHSASEIPSAYSDRFDEIVNMFRENMSMDGELRKIITHVDYSLRLCGASKETAHPSILVFCRSRDSKQLAHLFGRDYLKKQYRARKTTPKDLWRSWMKKGAEDRSQRPLFHLYLWISPKPHILLGFEDVNIRIESGNGKTPSSPPNTDGDSLTLCGLPISQMPGGHRTATLGCVLRVDSGFYGLTAFHGLRPYVRYIKASSSKTQSKPEKRQSISPEEHLTGGSTIDKETRSLFEEEDCDSLEYDDDVIYDDLTDEDSEGDDGYSNSDSESDCGCSKGNDKEKDNHSYGRTSGEGLQDNTSGKSLEIEGSLKERTSAVVAFMDTCDYAGQDLDWALIHLDQPEQHRPNAFFNSNDPSTITFIQPKAAQLPEQQADVFVLVSPRRVMCGVLQPLPSFLGSIEGTQPSTVWSVIMNGNES